MDVRPKTNEKLSTRVVWSIDIKAAEAVAVYLIRGTSFCLLTGMHSMYWKLILIKNWSNWSVENKFPWQYIQSSSLVFSRFIAQSDIDMASNFSSTSRQRSNSTGQADAFIVLRLKSNDSLKIIAKEDLSPALRNGRLRLNHPRKNF